MTELAYSEADPYAIGCTDVVTEVFTGILERISSWRDEIVGAVELERPSARTLDALIESLVVPSLSAPPPAGANANITGAGFVATPGYLPDAYWHLSWWLGEQSTMGVGADGDHSPRRLEAVTDPLSDRFRDYTHLEWWRVPERTGAPHITGPYVDYLCTDDYTLTVTMPVYSGSALIGMVGVDSYVKHVEALLLPHLFRIGSAATVVNASGRVVVSSDPHRAPGSILRIAGLSELLHGRGSSTGTPSARRTPLPGGQLVLECPVTGLELVLNTELTR